ncbi:hypothetical protein SMU63_05076 [Streptococcus mutans T4]|nr:hypothetical protein SMUGS5_05960 [Streptococcus mutans GS-5]AMF85186.1 hypothetical protein APQ13_01720 [Streptococcus mutans]EMB52837.1 hypothetical protein SMU3_06929 [Streptococcus mutans 11A1]EMB81019.1 hypothetical protein SMU52_06746 [Streptococcus mutans NFSM2]EMB85395.1 hypothetical protein SMU53_01200 [Streptococcus mutans NVAB]EMB86236.1 hypothetical protein SMU54_03532 [Streptococcus mutans A9]EMB99902.1 hypothetical protein SMU63_05076 [Streptococcus mutans T4]EMC12068.1 hypo
MPKQTLHDGYPSTHHSATQMLDNVKPVQNNLSIWKQLFDDGNVASRHVHSHDFNPFSNHSRVVVEVVFNG